MVTVPTFGFGIMPRGPRTLPSRPTSGMRSGVAMQRSKSIAALHLLHQVLRADHVGTGGLRLVALAPRANTATRTRAAEPLGRLTMPRTIWSAWRGSTPRFIRDLDRLVELAFERSLTIFTASSSG